MLLLSFTLVRVDHLGIMHHLQQRRDPSRYGIDGKHVGMEKKGGCILITGEGRGWSPCSRPCCEVEGVPMLVMNRSCFHCCTCRDSRNPIGCRKCSEYI